MRRYYLFIFLFLPIINIAQTIKLQENFETLDFPQDWTIINNDGYTVHPEVVEFTEAWTVVQDPSNSQNNVIGSTSYFQPVDKADRWLISPQVELDAFGNFISWYAKSHDPSYPDSYKVLLSNGGTAIEDFQDTVAVISNEGPDGILRELLIEGKENQTVRFAFVNTTFNGFKLYLDSIKVRTNDPLSVDTYQKESISLTAYPTPSSDIVKLSTKVDSYAIYAISGELVQQSSEVTQQLSLSDLNVGIYILHAVIKGEAVRIKLVKK